MLVYQRVISYHFPKMINRPLPESNFPQLQQHPNGHSGLRASLRDTIPGVAMTHKNRVVDDGRS